MEVHYLLLNKPVTLELVVGLLPARDIIHVALINGRDPPKLPVIPRVRLSAAWLHNRLPEPLDRLLEHGVIHNKNSSYLDGRVQADDMRWCVGSEDLNTHT